MGKPLIRSQAVPAATLGVTILSLAIAGCGEDKTPQAATVAAKKSAAARQGPQTPVEQTATMVEAPTSGRTSAPVHLKYEIAERPVAGQTIVLRLALLPETVAQSLALQVNDTAGLVLADRAEKQFGAAQPDSVYRQEITLSAPAEGVFFLSLTATITHEATAETRTFTIPIIVAAS